jgi:molybdate transport system substrate-binding protein
MKKFLALFVAILSTSALAQADTVTVSAAVSLKETLTEIGHDFQADTGNQTDMNFGASGTLAVQIEQGAPVDLFISAGNKEVNALIAGGFADGNTRVVVAGNQLVLIVPKDFANPPAKLDDLLDDRFKHVAVGEAKVVPAGMYAMQTLKSAGLDEKLASKLVFGENVRQVLSYVIRGEADAGLVYATDAQQAKDSVQVALVTDSSSHEPIVYPAVIVKAGKHDLAGQFLEYLHGDKAKAVLMAHGFSLPVAEPATQPSP